MKIKNNLRAIIFVYFGLFFCTNGLDLPHDICEGKDNVFIAHPDVCTQFIYCFLENPVVGDCEYPTEIFSDGNCVAGNPITCEIFTTTITSLSPITPPITVVTHTTTEIGEITENPTITTQSQNTETTTQSKSTSMSHEISSGTSTTTSRIPTPPLTIFTRTTTTSVPEITNFTSTTTQRQTPPPGICDGSDFMFVADPNYCFRFYFCVSGVASHYECAPNTIFNEQLQRCIDGDWHTCESHTTTTELTTLTDEQTTTTRQHPPDPPNLCDGNDFRFIPNPDYCFRFYFCMSSTAVPYECAPNAIFSDEFQGCIDGDWETCEPHQLLL